MILRPSTAGSPVRMAPMNAILNVWTALAVGHLDKGIAVSSVCPGWCRTEMGGPNAPRSVQEGAAGTAWLVADAPQEKTGLFWRDKEVLPW